MRLRDLPGELASLGLAHPYLTLGVLALGTAMTYIGAFALYQRRVERRDTARAVRRYR